MDKFVNRDCVTEYSKVRIKAFDVLKLYAIFLVLWGHSIQYFLSTNYFDEPVYRIIYSFHMPLFIMVSGYFSLSSIKLSLLSFIKKKFIQLLLPSFSWIIVLQFVLFIYNTHFMTLGPSLWIVQLKGTISSIIYGFYGPHPFWFLKTCFACYMLAYCGSRLRLNKYLWMCITLIISQRISHFTNFDVMYPCFIVGMELKDNQKFYYQICRNYLWLFGLFLLMLCFWDQSFWGYDGIIKIFIVNSIQISNPHLLFIVLKIYKLTIGIIGSLAFIGLICSLIPQDKTNNFITLCCNWGQYSLGIYILQSFILEIIMAKFIHLDNMNFYVFNFIISPIISFMVLVSCVYIIKKMSKSATLALLFYGKSR